MRFRPRQGAAEPADPEGPDPATGLGPWDVSEVEEPAEGRVDLGGLLVRPRETVELRLQADQASGALVSILLSAGDGGVELRPFASAKDVDQWEVARGQIAELARRQGTTVTERDGVYGAELLIEQQVEIQGETVTQASRMVGFRGPRWVLRATFYGRYATDDAPDCDLIATLRDTVVVRGSGPIPPGEMIPLRLPPGVELSAEAAPSA